MVSPELLLLSLIALMLAWSTQEMVRHRRNLARLPVRVHVNGTRGKSSVTRLIAAGLRAGGLVVCAKTTGTLARMILPDGRELPLFRPSSPNVIEQLRVVNTAVSFGAQALVVECMALQPELQWLSESHFIRATHGVITNARPDHLDVMGPEPEHVAQALAGMTPRGAKLFTAEARHLAVLEDAAKDRGSTLVHAGEDAAARVTEDELAGFAYREHATNVALALTVCEDLGVPRAVALAGMQRANPDPGAMTEHHVSFFGRDLVFVNGFAANDPVSTEQIWRMAIDRHHARSKRIAIFNCRADRADRSQQLGQALATWPKPHHVVLMGSGTFVFAKAATKAGMDASSFHFAEEEPASEIFELVVSLVDQPAMIMGMGNIGGRGLEVVKYFKNRSKPTVAST